MYIPVQLDKHTGTYFEQPHFVLYILCTMGKRIISIHHTRLLIYYKKIE